MRSRLQLIIGIVLFSILALVAVYFWFAFLHKPAAILRTDQTAHLSNHGSKITAVAEEKHVAPVAEKIQNHTLTLNSEQLRSIGVTFAQAERRSIEKEVRTIGRVAADERRVVAVTIKVNGWIEQLFVNSTGEYVKKGQPLFTIYSPELFATEQEYLLALQAVKELKHSPYAEVSKGSTSLLDVAYRRLQLWDITDEQIRELNQTGKASKTLVIHSPITGTVIEKTALVGMQVNAGDQLYTLTDLSHVWVLADVYESEVAEIQSGQIATVTLSYAPHTILQGRVSFIYPTVNHQTRTIKVRLEFDNPNDLLKPGMYAKVKLEVPLGTRLVIPTNAVLESGERSLVFIDLGNGQLEWRNVKLGVRTAHWIEIIEGVKEGEKVVASANFLIDSESQLKSAIGGMKH